MKRQLGTALSVAGVLIAGTAAAAINVRLLHVTDDRTASQLTARMAADVVTGAGEVAGADATGVAATASSASDVMQQEPGTSSAPATAASRPPRLAGTTGGKTLVPGGSTFSREHDDDDDDDDDREHADRPPLDPAVESLLRVSKMVRLSPEVVRAAAKGTGDAATIAKVRAAAEQMGISLATLATAPEPPLRPEGPGHGPEDDDDREDEHDD